MASPYERVRVEDPDTGHQFTTTAAHAANANLKVLTGKDAVDKNGRVLPPLHRTDKAGQSAPRSNNNTQEK